MPPTLRSSRVATMPSDTQNEELAHQIQEEELTSDREMYSSELEDDMMDEEQPEPQQQTSAVDLLRPLHETSERVGRQLEEFAQELDKFNQSRAKDGQKLWEQTWTLMDKYKTVTNRYIKSAAGRHNRKDRQSLGDGAKEEQSLKLEAQLWDLEAALLPCQSPEMVNSAAIAQNTALVELHRYSSSTDLWTAFMDVDCVANQYEALLDWLQQWRKMTSEDLQDNKLARYDASQRGEDAWDAGNIFTQGPIKRQKVARAHPGPLETDEDLRQRHYRNSDHQPLVSQMDPDAPFREDALLELEDESYEYSAWHASLEHLLRGSTPVEIRSWWKDRNQLWRAAALRASVNSADAESHTAWLRIQNLMTNGKHLDLCRELALNNHGQNEYETAVYEIMSGREQTTRANDSITDDLFILINALWTKRYEQFLAACQQKIKSPEKFQYTPASTSIDQVVQYVKDLQVSKPNRLTGDNAHEWLECQMMCVDLSDFLVEMGHAAAVMAYQEGQYKILFDLADHPVSEPAKVASQNPDLVRITAHLQLALGNLGLLQRAYDEHPTAMEDNIVNYIGILESHGKYSLLPLYASSLSSKRQPRILGRLLSRISEPAERDRQMRLMKAYNISANAVIYTICDYARQTWALDIGNETKGLSDTKIVHHVDKIVRIRSNFMGDEINAAEAHVLQAHEWIKQIDAKNWGMAAWLMAALYKTLLIEGKLAVAKALIEQLELSDTSLLVTGMNLSLAGLLSGDEEEAEDTEEAGMMSPRKRKVTHLLARESTDRSTLTDQSTVWAHLEYLVRAMVALETWQSLADMVEKIPRGDQRAIRSAKAKLSQSIKAVHLAMQPLLEEDFLNEPTDEPEAQALEDIRNHYLPECVLAYNSALYFAGHVISRAHLVQCMDLAQQVAQNDSLTKAFTASKRMQELVTAFAFDSQALLRANEQGPANTKTRIARRGKDGEIVGRPDIWQVSMRGKSTA